MLLSLTARAETPAEMAQAKHQFMEGISLFHSGDFARALTEFEGSYRLRPVAEVLYNIALTDAALGRYLDAIASAERYQHDVVDRGGHLTADRKAEVIAKIAWWRGRTGSIAIRVEPASAVVFLDGRETEIAKGPIALDPGIHTVEARAIGFVTSKQSVAVLTGQLNRVSLALESRNPPKPVAAPAAKKEPVAPPPVAESEDREPSVERKDDVPPPVEPKSSRSAYTKGAAFTGTIAAGAVVAAVVTGVLTLQQRANYDMGCDRNQCDQSLYNDGHQLAVITDVLIGVAGVATLTTVILALVRPSEKAPRVTIAPWLGRANGLALETSF
jgi:hypothetical protein